MEAVFLMWVCSRYLLFYVFRALVIHSVVLCSVADPIELAAIMLSARSNQNFVSS